MAVLPVVADPEGAAPAQPDPARPLDLQKECVDRIVDPEELEPAPRKRPVLDLSTCRRLRAEIGGFAVKRRLIAAMTLPRAIELDLVISGEQSFRRSIVGYGKRNKPCIEKLPGCCVVPWRQRHRRFTYRPPVANPPEINACRSGIERGHISPGQDASTGFEENRKRRRETILCPAGKPVETNRFEAKSTRPAVTPERNRQNTDDHDHRDTADSPGMRRRLSRCSSRREPSLDRRIGCRAQRSNNRSSRPGAPDHRRRCSRPSPASR